MERLKLINFIFLQTARFGLPVIAAMAVIQLLSFGYTYYKVNVHYVSYETILSSSYYGTIFIISYVVLLTVFAAAILSFGYSNKSIYTLLQIQSSKNELYYCFFTSGIMHVLMLWTAQILVVFFGYFIYESAFFSRSSMIGNGLFLSFIRYDFLRPFFPLTFFEWTKLLFLIMSPVLATMYLVFNILREDLKKLWIVLPWAVVLWAAASSFRPTGNLPTLWTVISILVGIAACIIFFISSKNLLSNKSIF